MKYLKFIKRFRGISISFLKLQLNEWDGYGIIFLSIAIFNGGCINSRSLFFVNVYPEYSSGGKKIRIMAGLFFFYWKIWQKTIRPPKDRCEQCDDLCETKEFYNGDTPYCSSGCRDF